MGRMGNYGQGVCLQDPALAIHPPTLYLGYVGFVIPFACAISFLINGDPEIKWEKLIRKWLRGITL